MQGPPRTLPGAGAPGPHLNRKNLSWRTLYQRRSCFPQKACRLNPTSFRTKTFAERRIAPPLLSRAETLFW